MDDTRTRFCAAIPASRSANSKEVSRSRCFPTPLVRNMRVGTMLLPNLSPSKANNDYVSERLENNTQVSDAGIIHQ